jgi:hypothetical protein
MIAEESLERAILLERLGIYHWVAPSTLPPLHDTTYIYRKLSKAN